MSEDELYDKINNSDEGAAERALHAILKIAYNKYGITTQYTLPGYGSGYIIAGYDAAIEEILAAMERELV